MNPGELKQIAVLQEIDDGTLARLATALEERTYADGQAVFAEGDPGDSMYFIVAGCVRIEKRAQVSGGAAHKTIAVLESGDYFGEMVLFDQKPRSASAVASGETRLLRLSKASFDELHHNNSIAGLAVLFAMIRTSNERLRRLSANVVVYDEVGKAIGEALDLQTLLDVIMQQVSSALQADWGLLLLRSQFSDLLELRSQWNLTLTSKQIEGLSQGKGFLEVLLHDRQHRLVANFDEQEPFKSCVRLGFETASLLLSPIAVEGKLLGIVALGGLECDYFDLNALNLVRGVASQTAHAILNAWNREEQQARFRHSQRFVRF